MSLHKKTNMRPLLVAVIFIMFVLIIYATVRIAAEVRHGRYVSSDRTQLSPFVPQNIWLPGRAVQERAYREAACFMQECDQRGEKAWLIGSSRSASFRPGALYPWDQSITLGYSGEPVHKPGFKHLQLIPLLEPGTLETCTFGILTNVLRTPVKTRLKCKRVRLPAPSRDILDRLRGVKHFETILWLEDQSSSDAGEAGLSSGEPGV